MPNFGQKSQERLLECHDDLQKLFNEIIRTFDCTVLVGFRDKEAQDDAFEQGLSKKKFPNSKHNSCPSMAVDVAPSPVDWKDINRFYYFAGYVMGIAEKMGVKIRFGGDWNKDTQVKDETFRDLVHFELV